MAFSEFEHTSPFHRPWQVDYDLVAGEAGPVTLKSSRTTTNHQLVVQHIIVSVTTYSAKTVTFADSAGTPVPIAFFSMPAAAPTGGGNQEYRIDFQKSGTPLTIGKNLVMTLSAAGLAGRIHIEGYEVIATPMAAGSTN